MPPSPVLGLLLRVRPGELTVLALLVAEILPVRAILRLIPMVIIARLAVVIPLNRALAMLFTFMTAMIVVIGAQR
jgi:hypothetical protein